MSKFNLNEFETTGSVVFNNGVAGKVENVSISVEKRRADEPDTYPPYKLVVSDGSTAQPLNQGFYYNDNDDEARQTMTLQRIKSIAKAVVPEGFVYPEVDTYEQAVNALFKVIKENCEGKMVNVFTSYGYAAKPNKFLGLRMFDFIENPNEVRSRLTPKPSDILVRPEADAPREESTATKSDSDLW